MALFWRPNLYGRKFKSNTAVTIDSIFRSQEGVAHIYTVGRSATAVKLKATVNKPYPQLHHKIKMAQRVWVLCTRILWRELHFEMSTMKNAGFYSGETYYPPSDV